MQSLCFLFCLFILKDANGNEGVCSVSQQRCNCRFYGENETATTKSEYLAGTAGALTPPVVAVVTFAVWLFVKKLRSVNIGEDQKNDSADSDNLKHKGLLSSVANESNHDDSSRRGSTDSGFVGYSRRGSMVSPLSLSDQEIYVDDDPSDSPSKTEMPMKPLNRDDGRISSTTYNTWVQPQHQLFSTNKPPPPGGSDNINKWMEF